MGPPGVSIYGLHTESPPQLGMTWLQKDLDIQETSEHITVCLHLRLHFIYTDPALVLYIDGTFFAVGAKEGGREEKGEDGRV